MCIKTILLTTKCSGGCTHCPFSNPQLEHLFLSLDAVKSILENFSGTLVVISGGEPFEHPQLAEVLSLSEARSLPFRIATGGFIDLTSWTMTLKNLKFLQGISMGTDVLSSRLCHSNWAPIWFNNIKLFDSLQIPYSITFTLSEELTFNHCNFFQLQLNPQFIYLRYSKIADLRRWIGHLEELFPNIEIIQEKTSFLGNFL